MNQLRGTALLDKLLADEASINVLNKSNPRGNISVTAYRPDKTPMLLLIPKTWIPVCLSEQATLETIRGSNELRAQISKGMLEIITPEATAQILSDPDAQQEKNKLDISKYGTPESISGLDKFTIGTADTDEVHIQVQEIMNRDISDAEKLGLLRNESPDDWGKKEYKFIIANTDNQKLQKWATAMMEI